MQTPRDPSMEDILASIKRVIAEEKDLRAAVPPPMPEADAEPEEDVLELDHPVVAEATAPLVELGEPLLDTDAADSSRSRLEQLSSVAAAAPPPPSVNPLEEMLREMLRPALKQWLDEHLPRIVDEHVRREISRITGKPL
jgi:cell pole-organizing protein PopZ